MKKFVSYECYQDYDNRYADFLENIITSYGFPRKALDDLECAIMDSVCFGNEILEGVIIGINDGYSADRLHEEYFRMNGWTIADEKGLYE